jgi:hypothetical protein
MKKLLFITAIAGLTFACNSDSKPSNSDSTAATTTPAPAATDSSATAAQQPLKDGLMTMKDGKMMIVKSGAWAPMDSAMTCTNGRKVALDGTVAKGNNKGRKLEEGMMVDKDGQIMDKNGKPMDTSGWD